MAVPEQKPFIEYTANGTTTVYPLTFDCDKSEYLIVSIDGEEAPVGSWSLTGGSITFNATPTNGVLITIERNTPFRRTTEYQSYNNSFRPSPVNKDFDLIWWKLQELGYRDQVIWLALVKEIADRINGDENLQNQINTIDEWLANLQQNVNENTNDISQLVNDLSKEIADRITGDQILKDMFISMIDEAINEGTINALAIIHLDSLEALEGVTNVWDGRTIYIKDLGNYRYDALTTSWIKAYQDADNVKYGDKTQKQINDFSLLIEATPEIFGYISGDATQAFKDAALYAKNKNIPFIAKDPNGYLITDSINFYTDTKISKVNMPADGVYRYLSVKSNKIPSSVDVNTLSGLSVFSSNVAGFPLSAVGKYIKITSEDVLTERNNAPSNTPYTKNTAFHLLDSAGTISPSLDMSFSAGTTAQVYIMPTESRINFEIGEIVSAGTGLNHNSIVIERDSVDVSIGNVSASSGFRTLVSLTGNDCSFYSPVIKDAQYSGYGYGISIGLCCDTKIFGMKGSNCTTSLDGRHGANVVVQDAKLEIAGSHWGNNYIFKNCDIGIVTWAGKDLKLDGGTLKDYVSMRVDVAMSIGTCEIVGTKLNSSSWVITPSSTIIADFFTSPRKVFDNVIVRNSECTANLAGIFGFGALTVFSGDYIPPQNFLFENIKAPNTDRLRLAYLNLANSLALTKPAIFKAKNIQAKNVTPFMARSFSKYPSSQGYEVRAIDCGKVFIQCDANTFSLYKLNDSTLVGANRVNGSSPLGDMIFDDCIIEHDSALATNGLFYIESRKGFMACEYRGIFNNGGAVNGVTMYSIAARAVTNASGFPFPLSNYINRTLYQRDEISISYDPVSILANSYIRQEFDALGAQMGDAVLASFSIYNAGIDISASVSATNKVSVLFKNLTGSPIDLASGVVKIKLL